MWSRKQSGRRPGNEARQRQLIVTAFEVSILLSIGGHANACYKDSIHQFSIQ